MLRELRDGSGLSADEVAALQAKGALVIDARSPEAFGAGHVPGAISVGLGSSFAIWAGWLTPYDRDLIVILDDDERFGEARTELRRIGLDRVAGYLVGGMAAWQASGREVVTLPQMTIRRRGEPTCRFAQRTGSARRPRRDGVGGRPYFRMR